MKSLMLMVAALALAAVSGCGVHDSGTAPGPVTRMISGQDANLSVQVLAETRVVGTLAPVGSFAYTEAPGYTRVMIQRVLAAKDFTAGKITRDQLQATQDWADRMRALLDHAHTVCGEDKHTGRCLKDAPQAQDLYAAAADLISRGVSP